MIPRKIHYCWFGRKPLPAKAKKCIASWRRFLPDYEIIEWNEDNFDVNSTAYTREAYKAGKYAFVSDYARFAILSEHGGLYFDTDVEIIRDPEAIIAAGPFMGFELDAAKEYEAYDTDGFGQINCGLGMGAEPHMELTDEIVERYRAAEFTPGTNIEKYNVVWHTTETLKRHGLKVEPGIQHVGGFTLYPSEYFCPKDYATNRLHITPNTISIHHYEASWHPFSFRVRRRMRRYALKALGRRGADRLGRIFHSIAGPRKN